MDPCTGDVEGNGVAIVQGVYGISQAARPRGGSVRDRNRGGMGGAEENNGQGDEGDHFAAQA